MKILLLFPMADGQTGPAIKYAFEQLGHTVKAIDAKLQPKESYGAACEFKPDFVFCSRTLALTDQVRQIKQDMDVTACMWNVDTRLDIYEWRHLFPLIMLSDYHFVVDEGTVPWWRKDLNKNTFWLPEGIQSEIYGKAEDITEEDRAKYSCDVCWIGNRIGRHHGFRAKYLDAIETMGIKFKQWGCKGNPQIWNKEHNKAVYLSKINISCSMLPENKAYCSERSYKILGGGGFLLELYREGLEKIFPPDVFDTYTSPETIVEKVKYWLENEKKRKEIAERGSIWVRENATFTHRIKMALDYMGYK